MKKLLIFSIFLISLFGLFTFIPRSYAAQDVCTDIVKDGITGICVDQFTDCSTKLVTWKDAKGDVHTNIPMAPYSGFCGAKPGDHCCVHPDLAVNIGVDKPSSVKVDDVGRLISSLISVAFVITGLICFVFLVWGGIQWITSGGDKAGVEAAQKRIQAAIIGLLIVFASWAIMKVLEQFFGISIFNISFPKPF